MRGKHNNRTNKLNEIFSKIFEKFLNNFPKVLSDYTSSNKFDFENRDLNITILFNEFNKFIINENLRFDLVLTYETFRTFF
jgi:frataxin-like iron-binding protein CyaY